MKICLSLLAIAAMVGCQSTKTLPLHVNAADLPKYSIAGGKGSAILAVNAVDNGCQVSFGLLELDSGVLIPEHIHEHSDEIIYTTAGAGIFTLNGVEKAVKQGDIICVPAGMKHSFKVTGSAKWKGTQLYSPGGPEERFRGLK